MVCEAGGMRLLDVVDGGSNPAPSGWWAVVQKKVASVLGLHRSVVVSIMTFVQYQL